MLRSVKISHNNESITLEIFEPTDIYVKNITGLGPVDVEISESDYNIIDGSIIKATRLRSRNIVFTLGYINPANIIELRRKLYKTFASKIDLRMEFVTDDKTVYINGYVEMFDPDIFSEDANISISIVCPDPLFKSIETKVVNFDELKSNFEFPFSNESIINPLIETSTLEIKENVSIYYSGDYEVGFNLNVYILDEINDLSIFKTFPDTHILTFDTAIIAKTMGGVGLKTGDVIKISTKRNDKNIRLYRDGVHTNILNATNKNLTFPYINIGDNLFSYDSDYKPNVSLEILYNEVYVGI